MNKQTQGAEPRETNIAPWLSVNNTSDAVEYYIAAFNAVELYRLEDENGKLVIAQLAIKGADFWIQEDPNSRPESAGQGSVRMIMTVKDPDFVFAQALTAGATEVSPINEDYGWRIGRIVDPFGYHWEVGRQLS
jgi:PhnB protein